MARITVLLCIFVLLFFILTRKVWLNVKFDGRLRLELHLPILAVYLEKRRDEKVGASKKPTKKKRDRTSFGIIVKHLLRLAERCELTVKRLSVPAAPNGVGPKEVARIYGYYSFFSAIFAYLEGKAQKLNIYGNALDLYSDKVKSVAVDLTLKSELYVFLLGFISFYIDHKRNKLKERQTNAG